MKYGPDEDRNLNGDVSNRGRKDDPALTKRLTACMIEALAADGYDALRLDDIAKAIGTSKQSIYRRWPSKAAFAAAALELELARIPIPVPERVNAARDLHRLVRGYLTELRGNTGKALLQVRTLPAFQVLVRNLEQDIGFHIRQCLIATPFERDLEARAALVLGLIWQQLFNVHFGFAGLDQAGLESGIYMVLGLVAPRDPIVSGDLPGL